MLYPYRVTLSIPHQRQQCIEVMAPADSHAIIQALELTILGRDARVACCVRATADW
jgi:hypothetical protein